MSNAVITQIAFSLEALSSEHPHGTRKTWVKWQIPIFIVPVWNPAENLNLLKQPPFHCSLLIEENINEKLWDGITFYWKITITTIILIEEYRKGRVFYSQKDIHHWGNKNSSWRQYSVWFPRQRQNDNWPCPGHIVYGKRDPVCQGASKLNFPRHPAWKQWKNKNKTSWDMTWVWNW